MEKVKFGIQIMVLLLAFPVWIVTEIKQADKEIKKNRLEKEEAIKVEESIKNSELKEGGHSNFKTISFSKLMVINS